MALSFNIGNLKKAVDSVGSIAGNALGGNTTGKPNANTRNDMLKKIYALIPGKVSNSTVVGAFEAMRAQQKMMKKDYSGHKASNASVFKSKHDATVKKNGGFVEDQNSYTDMAYGESTMQYSGCEVFATFNAIYSIKGTHTIPLSDMIASYEKDGMVFAGKFGTSPKAIADYLNNNGFKAQMTTNEDEFDSYGISNKSLILTMYNDKNDITKEVHTVNISKSGNKFTAHNVYCNGTVVGPYNSVSEVIKNINGGKAKGISLIGVN